LDDDVARADVDARLETRARRETRSRTTAVDKIDRAFGRVIARIAGTRRASASRDAMGKEHKDKDKKSRDRDECVRIVCALLS